MAGTPHPLLHWRLFDLSDIGPLHLTYSVDFSTKFYSCITGGNVIVRGSYGPAWKFLPKLFMAAIRQYLSDQQLVKERIFQQAERLLQNFEDQKRTDLILHIFVRRALQT